MSASNYIIRFENTVSACVSVELVVSSSSSSSNSLATSFFISSLSLLSSSYFVSCSPRDPVPSPPSQKSLYTKSFVVKQDDDDNNNNDALLKYCSCYWYPTKSSRKTKRRSLSEMMCVYLEIVWYREREIKLIQSNKPKQNKNVIYCFNYKKKITLFFVVVW